MQSSFNKHILIGCWLIMSCIAVYTLAQPAIAQEDNESSGSQTPGNSNNSSTLTIPTTGADHRPFLTELYVENETSQQKISVNTQGILSIAGSVNIGDIKGEGEWPNTISQWAIWSMIAGGTNNKIGTGASYSFVGGGNENASNSPYGVIVGGNRNTVSGNAGLNSIIFGGEQNIIESGSLNYIFGGFENTIKASSASILGGQGNTVSKKHSVAAGENVTIHGENIFAWSDYDYSYVEDDERILTGSQDDSFLVRSLNGFAINETGAIAGVNVNLSRSVWLSGSALSTCNTALAGSFASNQSCTYFCDGEYRHIINNNLEGDNVETRCYRPGVAKSCMYGTVPVRVGTEVLGFVLPIAPHCPSAVTVTCQADGTFSGFEGSAIWNESDGIFTGHDKTMIWPDCFSG